MTTPTTPRPHTNLPKHPVHTAPTTGKSQFEGTNFVEPATPVTPGPGIPSPFLTKYDEDGACLFDFVEAKWVELGRPNDYNHLYVWDGAIKAFPDMDPILASKIQANAFPQNHPFGAPLWTQAWRLTEKLPNGNWDQAGKTLIPNAYSCIANLTLGDFRAYIGQQTKENYFKQPCVLAGLKPVPYTPHTKDPLQED